MQQASQLIASVDEMQTRTYHIIILHHHYCAKVYIGHMTIKHISTNNQLANFFTKPVNVVFLKQHPKIILN